MTRHASFLAPLRSSTALWKETHLVNADVLQANIDSFLSHANNDMVPDEVMCEFVKGKYNVFLAGTRLLTKFESAGRSREIEEVVQWLNTFCGIFDFGKNGKHEPKKRSTCLNCPLIWINLH